MREAVMSQLSTFLLQVRPVAGLVIVGAVAVSVLLAVVAGTFAANRQPAGFLLTLGLTLVGVVCLTTCFNVGRYRCVRLDRTNH